MKLLVAIKSCNRDIPLHDAIRNTWGRDLPVRFFVGRGEEPLKEDETRLDVGDGYNDLPEKVRAMVRWSIANDYDYIFPVDNDSFIHPSRLLALWRRVIAMNWDYVGRQYWYTREVGAVEGPFRFAFGGLGYFLSRRAQQILADAPLEETTNEDEWVGYSLKDKNIRVRDMHFERYERWVVDHYIKKVYPDRHYCVGSPWQENMYRYHVMGDVRAGDALYRHNRDIYPAVTAAVGNTPLEKIKAAREKLKDSIQANTTDQELTYIHERLVAVGSLYEIEKKPLDAINLGEWECLVIGYRELGEAELSLRAAKIAYPDDTLRSRIRMAGAYDFAGDYDSAYEILRAISATTKDSGVAKLLEAVKVKRFLNERRRKQAETLGNR